MAIKQCFRQTSHIPEFLRYKIQINKLDEAPVIIEFLQKIVVEIKYNLSKLLSADWHLSEYRVV